MEYNLAFSSSGVRFAAHVGVLAYLQDNGIRVRNFSGTSGGAIVAAWGANALLARELMQLTLKYGYPKYFVKPSLNIGGLLDHSLFGDLISTFCKPKKNLWIVTFNVLKMQKEVWNGEWFNLSKVLCATTCIPGLFKPIMYSNGLHIDGVFARFCPDDLWTSGVTISVQLKCRNKSKSRYPFDFFVHEIEKATINFLYGTQSKNINQTELINIQPDVSSIAQTDLLFVNSEDHKELFEKGYESARKIFGTVLKNKEARC